MPATAQILDNATAAATARLFKVKPQITCDCCGKHCNEEDACGKTCPDCEKLNTEIENEAEDAAYAVEFGAD